VASWSKGFYVRDVEKLYSAFRFRVEEACSITQTSGFPERKTLLSKEIRAPYIFIFRILNEH